MDKSKIGLLSLVAIVIVFLSSCEKENLVTTNLVTEEVIYISGERVRVLGRIITTQNVSASDHGFYISENAAFTQPIIISLGERVAPGRFIGETDALNIDKEYYIKSFIAVPEGIQFGNVLEVKTLQPKVQTFSPNNGPVGTVITIRGNNFTTDTKVLFGNREARITRIDFESSITAIVPPSGTLILEELKVVVQGKELIFDEKFEYTTGKFTQLPNFPSSLKIFNGISFQTNDGFYAGLGANNGQSINSEIWKYSLATTTWEKIPFPGTPLWRAFSGGNYFGGGALVISQSGLASPSRDFWKYENQSFFTLPDFPSIAVNAASFELSGKLYVIGGSSGLGTDAYRFTIATGIWEKIGNSPFAIDGTMLNFNHGGRQYIVNPQTKEIYYFDGVSETWSYYGNYPGEIASGFAMGVTIGDRVITGMANRGTDVWELNINTGVWISKNVFTGNPIARNVGVYVQDGLIYILRSGEVQVGGLMEFWVLDPFGL